MSSKSSTRTGGLRVKALPSFFNPKRASSFSAVLATGASVTTKLAAPGSKASSGTNQDPTTPHYGCQKSDTYGSTKGDVFDEGATWLPLKSVHFTATSAGVYSYRGVYGQGPTNLYGKDGDDSTLNFVIDNDERITAINGTYNTEGVTWLQIRTNKQQLDVGQNKANLANPPKPFNFTVPDGYAVAGFHGRADDTRLRAIGISYILAPVVRPVRLLPVDTKLYIDDATKALWDKGDLTTIYTKRMAANQELQPIFDDIKARGKDAWTPEKSGKAEGLYHASNDSGTASVWAFTKDIMTDPTSKTKTTIMTLGSYSESTNLLATGGYVWENIPDDTSVGDLAKAFAHSIQGMIIDGLKWGLQYAAGELAKYIEGAGLVALAALVPEAVASYGGLAIGVVLGVALFFAVLYLPDILFRKFYLEVEIYNFDTTHAWQSIQLFRDNAASSNGAWQPQILPKSGPYDATVLPTIFAPSIALTTVVSTITAVFENVNTFLEGVGAAILVSRDDYEQGLAVKYVVHALSQNELGDLGVASDPTTFDLPGYYNGDWAPEGSYSAATDTPKTSTYTPSLSGVSDNTYHYYVRIDGTV